MAVLLDDPLAPGECTGRVGGLDLHAADRRPGVARRSSPVAAALHPAGHCGRGVAAVAVRPGAAGSCGRELWVAVGAGGQADGQHNCVY
ncbi:MAG: hypothetical protein ACRD0H_06425 [Actinomycetes bacterium]